MDAAAGDARLAIGILRMAAGKADRENHERIIGNILLDAAEDARAQIRQKGLNSLTPHQRIVYNIVREHGPVGSSEIHERYTEEVDDLRTKRTICTYLLKMAQYNLLAAEGLRMGLNEVVDALERAKQLLEDGETGPAQDSLSWQYADDDAEIQLGKACAMLGTCRQLRQGTNNYVNEALRPLPQRATDGSE